MTTVSPTFSLPGKRKRTEANYLEDSELDSLLELNFRIEDDDDSGGGRDDDDDGDATYASRKVKQKKPTRKTAKRARLASKPRAKKDKKPFPFLSLPRELRECIYELALTDQHGITLFSKIKNYRRTVGRGPNPSERNDTPSHGTHRFRRARLMDLDPQPSQPPQPSDGQAGPANPFIPALLAVNKQIHSEAIGFLYRQPIVVEDTYALHNFLAAIGSNRARVRNIVICGWGEGRGIHKAMNFSALTLLADCRKLKSLFFDCTIHWAYRPKNVARQLYRDGHYFLESYGAANGSKDAALKILHFEECNYRRPYVDRDDLLPDKESWKDKFEKELRKLLMSHGP